jgi:hypothetical protein
MEAITYFVLAMISCISMCKLINSASFRYTACKIPDKIIINYPNKKTAIVIDGQAYGMITCNVKSIQVQRAKGILSQVLVYFHLIMTVYFAQIGIIRLSGFGG